MTLISLRAQQLLNIHYRHRAYSALPKSLSTIIHVSKTASGIYLNVQSTPPKLSCSSSAELVERMWRVLRYGSSVQSANENNNSTSKKFDSRNCGEEIEDQNNIRSDNYRHRSVCKRATATTNAMESARIVIIGAGAAGIAAATCLLQSGCGNVLLLEAENRFGGRVHTLPFADNVVDLGAQWCHGEKGNVIYELVKDLNMLQPTATIYDDYKCVRSNKEVLSEAVADTLKSIVFNFIPARQEGLKGFEGSLGTYLTEAFWRDLQQLPDIDRTVAREFFENYKKFESSIEASDHLFEVSGQGHLEYWVCEGDLLLNWKDKGFRSFLRLLMKAKKGDEEDLGLLNKRIQYNSRVENIEWQTANGRVRIRLWNGELIEADHVISTVSLGVLKENHKRLFTPALPHAKCRAIDGLKLGTVDKFFLEFEEPFGPCDWSSFCFLWCEDDLTELRNSDYFWLESVFGFYRVSCQPRILQGWIIGPHARHMETLPKVEVLNALLWLFKKFFTFEINEPLNFLRTRWYTNPNFRGSYTFRTMYADELRIGSWDLAAPLTDETNGKPLLQFAGEATHSHFYSTVHGAVESGWREAQRLIAYYLVHTSQL